MLNERPRILLIAQNLPYPTFSGMDLRNWQNVNCLLSLGEVGVFGLCSNDNIRAISPNDSLAFWRCTADPDLEHPLPPRKLVQSRAWLLNSFGHPGDVYESHFVVNELQDLLRDFKPEIAVVEGLWMHHYFSVLRAAGCARIVFDCHDTLAEQDHHSTDSIGREDFKTRVIDKVLSERVRLLEYNAVHAVDQLWVCSVREAELIERFHQPEAPIRVIPNGVNVGFYNAARTERSKAWQSKKNLIYLGLFAYQPNRLAAASLIEDIFPWVLRSFDDFRLILAGGWPTDQMQQAARADCRIVVTGAVPDIRPYLADAFAMVVPLSHGRGTRLKIVEAFAAGVPVITTAKGAEGLEIENERHLLIAETPEEFVDCLRLLRAEPGFVEQLTRNAFELVNRQYSWQAASVRVGQAINELLTK